MKMEITLSLNEAKELLAKALSVMKVGAHEFEVTEVEWQSYSTKVVFTLETPTPAVEPPSGDIL